MDRPWSIYLSGNKNMLFSLISLFIVDASLFSLTLLFGSILGSPATLATSTSAVSGASVTVQVACTLNGIGMNTHNAEIPNGTYRADIGTTTLKAFCNDGEGFAIYAAGYTGDIIGDTNSNKLVGTTSSGSAVINTGLATSAGNPDTSNWAMKLTLGTDSGDTTGTNALAIDSDTEGPFSTYHTVPNEYTKVAHKNSATSMDETTGGATITSTYAAYISKTQATGGYAGQVIYTLVHPADANPPEDCNPNAITIDDMVCMQDFASLSSERVTTVLNSMTLEQQYTLKDKRDDKEYTIAKFADGNVWMTKSLDLDIDANTTYTNEDTDLGYNVTTGAYGTASWTPTSSTYATTSTQTHEWCDEDGGIICNYPESYDPGELYWNGVQSNWNTYTSYYDSCDRSGNVPICDLSILAPYYSTTSSVSQYHMGNYYNWAAALATNDSSVYDNLDVVEHSICPAGWTLPRAGTGEDSFYGLWNQYGLGSNAGNENYRLWEAPFYFAADADFDGVLGVMGYGAGYWTAVAFEPTHPWHSHFAYAADFAVNGTNEGWDDVYRLTGMPVRCIARPVTHQATIPTE